MKKYIFNFLILSLGLLAFSPVVALASNEQLTITKNCSPSSCTAPDSFPFTVTDANGNIYDNSTSGTNAVNFTLNNSNSFTKTFTSFQNDTTAYVPGPNVYTITENTPSGWGAPSINCGGANIGFDTSNPNSVTFDYTPT